MMGNEKAFEEQRLRNKFLRDKVTSLELQRAATQHDVAGKAQVRFVAMLFNAGSLTISVLQACCAVTTEYGIPSNFVRKST